MDKRPTLYVLVRTDIDSMNSGKMAAQVSHATSILHEDFRGTDDFSDWSSETEDGYGTVIVIDGGTINNILEIVHYYEERLRIAGVVTDPTYSLRDGEFTHTFPLQTCAFVLLDDKDELGPISKLKLL